MNCQLLQESTGGWMGRLAVTQPTRTNLLSAPATLLSALASTPAILLCIPAQTMATLLSTRTILARTLAATLAVLLITPWAALVGPLSSLEAALGAGVALLSSPEAIQGVITSELFLELPLVSALFYRIS